MSTWRYSPFPTHRAPFSSGSVLPQALSRSCPQGCPILFPTCSIGRPSVSVPFQLDNRPHIDSSPTLPCHLADPPSTRPTRLCRDAQVVVLPQVIAAHLAEPIRQQLQQPRSTQKISNSIVTHRRIPPVAVRFVSDGPCRQDLWEIESLQLGKGNAVAAHDAITVIARPDLVVLLAWSSTRVSFSTRHALERPATIGGSAYSC